MKKGKNNKRKRNTLPEKSGIISFCISTAFDVYFGIADHQFGLPNIIVFILTAIVLLAVWIWLTVAFCKNVEKNKESYELQKESFLEYCGENNDIKEYHRGITRIDKKYTKKRKRERRYYITITTLLTVGVIVNSGMIVSQYSVMRGIRNTDETVAGKNDGFPINTTTVETTIVNGGDANKSITPEEEKEMENKTFILSEPERLEVVSDADVERAFYVSLDEDKLKKEVKEHLDGIRNQKKRSAILANSTEERLVAKAQSEEDVFLNKVDEAKKFRTQDNYEGWKSVIPNSNTLENIISDREFLLMSSDKDMDLDGVLCIRLANNNQSFADEYRLQGGKPQTVVFYYVETIKRTEDGLAYEDLPQGYRSKYTRYLKARYKDIADYIENNLEGFGTEREKYRQIMEKANAIYKTM